MEIIIGTNQILKVLQILSRVIFIGLCIEAGGIILNTIVSLFINPIDYKLDYGYFSVITLIMIIAAVSKSLMPYRIIKQFTDKKLKMSRPFSPELRHFIIDRSYLLLLFGSFSYFGFKYSIWWTELDLETVELQALQIGGTPVWPFLTVILFLIAQIVKKGMEIQAGNDLTI